MFDRIPEVLRLAEVIGQERLSRAATKAEVMRVTKGINMLAAARSKTNDLDRPSRRRHPARLAET